MIDPPRQPAAGVGVKAGLEHTVPAIDANDAVLVIFSLQFKDPMAARALSGDRLQGCEREGQREAPVCARSRLSMISLTLRDPGTGWVM
jgi:hypothetical protein